MSYQGLRERAFDAKRNVAIDQYTQLAKIYDVRMQHKGIGVSDIDDVPSDNSGFCLGEMSDYPRTDHFEEGQCLAWSDGRPVSQVSKKLNAKFKKVVDRIPDGSFDTKKINIGGEESLYV